MPGLTRRKMIAFGCIVGFMPARPVEASTPEFFRSAGCGCCHKWSEAMASAGLPVRLTDVDDLDAEHRRLGVPEALRGCHVGTIDGYAISGHVPPSDINRLLTERPKAAGLAVPGMPIGSPGMEQGNEMEPYAVLLFQVDGTAIEFARYG